MKNYLELINEANAIHAEQKKTKEKREVLMGECFPRAGTRQASEKAWNQHKATIAELDEKSVNLSIARQMAVANAKIAIFKQVLPVVLDTIGKYAGKPFGDKTREKFVEEVKTLTGCYVYFDRQSWGDNIELSPVCNPYDFKVVCGPVTGMKEDENHLFDGNRLKAPVGVKRFKLWGDRSEPYEDIPGTIAKMRELYELAIEKQKEFEAVCNQFNAFACGNIERLKAGPTIYERFNPCR